MVRFRFGFRGHGYGFGLGLGITNSKKIKKMETLHMTSLYVTYNLEKNINMCFGQILGIENSHLRYILGIENSQPIH